MMPSEAARAEENRIRAAYARRKDGDRYSWLNPGALFIAQHCEQKILALLRRSGVVSLDSKTILEVGCGTGHWLREYVKWGARPENMTGIDLLPERLAKARRVCPPTVRLQCASAAQLPFRNERFDLVFQSTVFTSVLDPGLKSQIASEMLRVVRNDGIIVWYDYHVNNPWNADVQGVKRQEINHLFQNCNIYLERITLLPPLTRLLAPYSYLLCCLLEKFPPLCTHYLGIVRKRSSRT
jgi:ubiquinone/menaquinone biosynthesis C-methylase UbiE